MSTIKRLRLLVGAILLAVALALGGCGGGVQEEQEDVKEEQQDVKEAEKELREEQQDVREAEEDIREELRDEQKEQDIDSELEKK